MRELDIAEVAPIHKLSTLRDGLRHAAACPAPSHMECPTFRRILQAAASAGAGRSAPRRDKAKRIGRR
jgi:hypothetical protein